MATAIDTVRHEVGRWLGADSQAVQQPLDEMAIRVQGTLREYIGRGGPETRRVMDVLHGTWLGHPLHSAMTDLPVGAWTTAVILDMVGAHRAAEKAIAVGVLGAVPVAVTGAADWSQVEGKPRRWGLVHALLNTLGLGLFVGSLLARRAGNRRLGVTLSTAGFGGVFLSAWIGGEMVYDMGTAVKRTMFEPRKDEFRVAAKASDLVEGRLTKGQVTLGGSKVPVVLLKRGDEVLALAGTCSHWGANLADGQVVNGDCVQCPWHGSTFSMRDGSVVHGPSPYTQPAYEARINGENVEVRPVSA